MGQQNSSGSRSEVVDHMGLTAEERAALLDKGDSSFREVMDSAVRRGMFDDVVLGTALSN